MLTVLPMLHRTRAAGGATTGVMARHQDQGLAGLLNADGTLNLRAGMAGSFDASGYRMELGANQEPRFVPQAAQAACLDNWDDHFALPGINTGPSAQIFALAVDGNNNVYVSGSFTAIGNLTANHIAKWDGSTWSPLGSNAQNGIDGTGSASALAMLGTDLYVGGFFTTVSDSTQAGISARSIARWSTTTNTWSPLGSAAQNGVSSVVRAIAVMGTDLYVGGSFNSASSSTQASVSARNIARWSTTTSTWSALGNSSNGVNNAVNALAVMGTDLYVGGQFTSVSSSTQSNLPVNSIARWSTTASTWSPLGNASNGVSGLSPSVAVLAVMGTDLYVGGSFTSVNDSTQFGLSANNIARWSTTANTWSLLGSAAQNGVSGFVQALAVMGTDLYVGGQFNIASDSTQTIGVNRVARWSTTASTWSWLGSPGQNGVSFSSGSSQVNALTVGGGNLYVGGQFNQASSSTQLNLAAIGIARWNLTVNSWSLMGGLSEAGVNGGNVGALAVIGTDLYVAGDYSLAGDVPVNRIAKWNGFNWSPLGTATQNGVTSANAFVTALAVIGTDLYVGGSFTSVSDSTQVNLSVNNIARWSPATNTWSPLGSAAQNGASGFVQALAAMGTDLYVGGSLFSVSSTQGGLSVNNIARWSTTTSTWSALGNSSNGVNNAVNALAVMGTDLYVGGQFTSVSSSTQFSISAARIARWSATTSTWSPLGSATQNGANSQVRALAVMGTDLYAGGQFTAVSDSTQLNLAASSIARWSPATNTWALLGIATQNGVNNLVSALAVIGPDLYVGGGFTTASDGTQAGLAANRVVRWDALSGVWDDLDGGVNNFVGALAPVGFGLYVGGIFTTSGCRFSNRVARFVVPPPDIRVRGNGIPITNHDTTPSAGDNTDFGVTSGGNGSVSKTFTIENLGLSGLSLSATPPVTISGANAADFIVTAQPATALAAGGLTTFTIQFTPGASGLRTATVTIASNDPNDSTFDFSIAGNAFAGAVWTGANSSDWHTASNWSNNTVPAPGSAVMLPATGVAHEMVISIIDVSVGSLTLNTGRTLTLANNRTLSVNSNATLTVGSGAEVIAGSGCTLNCGSGASLVNNGTLTNNQGGTINTSFGTTLTNNNTLNNDFGAAINNNFGATLTNASGATFNNNGTLNNNFGATVNNPGALVNLGTISNSGLLALQNGSLTVDGAAFLFVRASGTVTRTSGYVIGKMTRTFGAAGSFTFDVGTAGGYSPVSITATAGAGDLTVSATQGVQPALASVADKVLQRYWTLAATGNLTLNLVFTYPQADVMGNESNYRVIRVTGGAATSFPNTCPSPCVDAANNTATINGVTSFSDWTVGEPNAPTAIELARFIATSYDDGTLVEWQTGFEAANLGFNLYREEAGRRVPLNPQMIAGSALLAGAETVLKSGRTYSFWDSNAAGKVGVAYWLEDVDLNGQGRWHGPYAVQLAGGAAPSRRAATFIGQNLPAQVGQTRPVERVAGMPSATPQQISLQTSLAGEAAVKLWVKREGWYRVTAAELVQAGLSPKVNPGFLQLYADGRAVPINVVSDKQGQLAAIEFYGRGTDTAATDSRVYWLVAGPTQGLRIPQVKGEGSPAAAVSFLSTVERRDRTIYFSSLRNGEKENFFGAVVAAQAVDQTLTLQHVDPSATGTATIEVALQGVTLLPHRVWVYVNEVFAGESFFDGQAESVVSFSLSPSLLKAGDNLVRLVAQNGPADLSLVDYIRLSYWHSFTADDDALRFTAAGSQALTVNGFTTGAIRVLDVTDPDAVRELAAKIEQQKTGYAVTVTAPETGERRLLAIADAQAAKPVKLAANQVSTWRSAANGADLIVISRRDLFPGLQPLVALRQGQGLKLSLVDIDDIYDEFNFGVKSPRAVKDFLGYAKASWKIKPQYVLLAGEASYDTKDYLGFGDNDLVPTRLVDTQLMEAASDDWLGDFDGDGAADLAIGRLPARTVEEAAAMVRKIIDYERAQAAESVLLVADSNEGFDFEGASHTLRGLLPGSLRVAQINRGQLDALTAKRQLLEAIAQGQKVVNYTGHGSVSLWRGDLLTNDDARALTNRERLPVFVMMTCLNGYFDDPALDGLGEALLKAESGGAVAVWASSGMTLPDGQALMNQQMVRLMFQGGGNQRFGDLTRRAKQSVGDTDIRRTWILLGDPTMRVK